MKSFIFRGTAAAIAAVLLSAAAALSQTPADRVLAGTVELDKSPVSGVPVTLHRVTSEASGPVGTQVTDGDGSFRFALPAADSAQFEVFFATAEYLSVRYFGQPVHGGSAPSSYTVAVYDTTSSLPGAVSVARRDIVLIPETEGGWEANEIIRLHNSADRTLVSRNGLPTWEMRLPEGITDFQAGEGELTASEVARMGDRVMLISSVLPGDREIYLRYRIPIELEQAILPVGTPTDTFHVFVGQPSPGVEVGGMVSTNVVEVQGQRFVQYGTTDLDSGAEITLEWEAPASPPVAPETAGGIAAIVVLLLGSWFAIRSRGARRGDSAASPAAG